MNGTNAPHAPKMSRSNPLNAPRLRGMCRVLKPDRESFIFEFPSNSGHRSVKRVLSAPARRRNTDAVSARVTVVAPP